MTAPIENLTSQRNGAQRANVGKAGGAGTAVAGLRFGWGVTGGISDMKNSVRRPQAWQETDLQYSRNGLRTVSGSSPARRDIRRARR
ncbi:MAG: hypothetical protein H7337_19220 [Rhizobacter sp.]|nr:hypothetical protein [Rhizobacter sp.]